MVFQSAFFESSVRYFAAPATDAHSTNSVRRSSDCSAKRAIWSLRVFPTGGSHSRNDAVKDGFAVAGDGVAHFRPPFRSRHQSWKDCGAAAGKSRVLVQEFTGSRA